MQAAGSRLRSLSEDWSEQELLCSPIQTPENNTF